jgi:ribosomal protein S18 acetylase RimI-like enzyme
VSDRIEVRRVEADEDIAVALADVLVDCVEGGASLGFMSPLELTRAVQFWAGVLDLVARGDRILLVAEDPETGLAVGTVQVILTTPENQPHRGEITKMLVHRGARRRGAGHALMRAAEDAARDEGKTLLVLDTASADAERVYDRLGWQRVGVIPGYALGPEGGLVATTVFFKRLT